MDIPVEIKIIDLDTKRTKPSRKGSSMRHMYLELSDSPSAEWRKFFDAERSFPRHSMWRGAWIEGKYIVVDCVPEEIASHLADLKQDVASSNRKLNEAIERFTARQKVTKEAEKQAKEAEVRNLEDLKSKLNFD
jgi:hypothetical protein